MFQGEKIKWGFVLGHNVVGRKGRVGHSIFLFPGGSWKMASLGRNKCKGSFFFNFFIVLIK